MKYILLLLFMASMVSCNEDPKDYSEENEELIQEYLAANNLDAERSPSGLHYVILNPGTGDQPTSTSNVTVAYKGYFVNGVVFDRSSASGISFNLENVIHGWTEGITYFREGGSGILLIPAHLGYGSSDDRGIPGGSVLIFDITLISVN